MSWIDSLLNFIIPPVIFICIGYILYNAFKEPLKGLGGALGRLKDKIRGESPQQTKQVNIVYE